MVLPANLAKANNGSLELTAIEQGTQQPIMARLELQRGDTRIQNLKKTVSAGNGVILPLSLEMSLPAGAYQFRLTRGPEYKSLTGNFTLQRTSSDSKTIQLPRMLDMKAEGWFSCDLAVPEGVSDLQLRMTAEDLHAAVVIDQLGRAQIPQALKAEIAKHQPQWFDQVANASPSGDLLVYGMPIVAPENPAAAASAAVKSSRVRGGVDEQKWLGDAIRNDESHLAIANPFAMELPIWLASERIDGLFIMGPWLREDREVQKLPAGTRPPDGIAFKGPLGLGRYAESIYWKLLNAGFKLVPLAGMGPIVDQPANATTGYNRIYSTSSIEEPVIYEGEDDAAPLKVKMPTDSAEMMQNIWSGRTVVTNGPLLRPSLGGFYPGYTFTAKSGEKLQLEMALKLTVRDEVDYLEVIQNGRVFYSARLEEYKEAGGHLPPLEFAESGWALVRVVTRHPEHLRFASSAPWFVEFNEQPRISREAVEYFQKWQGECELQWKQLPKDQLSELVPAVQKARAFWTDRLAKANAD